MSIVKVRELILPGLGIVLIIAAVVALLWFVIARQNYFYEENVKKCENIAKLAGGSDSIYSGGECYIIKGTKLEKV